MIEVDQECDILKMVDITPYSRRKFSIFRWGAGKDRFVDCTRGLPRLKVGTVVVLPLLGS